MNARLATLYNQMLFFITGPGRTIWRAWKLGLKSGSVEDLGRHEVVIKKKKGETNRRLLENRVTDQWS